MKPLTVFVDVPTITYTVRWEIEVDANSPTEAAKIAFDEYHRPGSDATCFDVKEHDSSAPFEYIDVAGLDCEE